VLKKPGKLTADGYRHIMSHVENGLSIVQEIRALRHLLPLQLSITTSDMMVVVIRAGLREKPYH
jgi:hypothetical protein